MSLLPSSSLRSSRRSLPLLLLVTLLLVLSAGALRARAEVVEDDHDDHDHAHEEPVVDDHADHDDHAEESSPILGTFQRHHDDPLQAGAPLTHEQCHGETEPTIPAAFYAMHPNITITHEHTNETYAVMPAHPSCPEEDPLAWSKLTGNTLVRQCGSLWISIGAVETAAATDDSPAIEAGVVIVVRDGASGGFCATHLAKLVTAEEHHDDEAAAAASPKATWRTWVYAMIGVLISCVVSLIGIIFLMVQKARVSSFLPELLALSSGTFIGSVIFSLLPETALEVGMTVEVTAVILGGILFGMLSESAIHGGVHMMTRRRRHRHAAAASASSAADSSSNCRVITVEMVRDSSLITKAATAPVCGAAAADEDAIAPVETEKEEQAQAPAVAVQGEACTDQSHAGHHAHAHEHAHEHGPTVRMHIDSGAEVDADTTEADAAKADKDKGIDSPAPATSGDATTDVDAAKPIHSHSKQHGGDHKHKDDSQEEHGHGHSHGHGHGGSLTDPKHAAMINCLADAIHNFIDGALIGATFLVNPSAGWTTTVAITLHELPQELSDFALLLHAGLSTWQAGLVNFLVSLTSVVGALVAIGVGETFALEVLNVLPFSVGLFLYLALAVLVPTMMRVTGRRMWRVWGAFAVGIALMAVLLALPWEHGHGEEGEASHAGHGH